MYEFLQSAEKLELSLDRTGDLSRIIIVTPCQCYDGITHTRLNSRSGYKVEGTP